MCEWKPDFDGLNDRVTSIEGRMSQVEQVFAAEAGAP